MFLHTLLYFFYISLHVWICYSDVGMILLWEIKVFFGSNMFSNERRTSLACHLKVNVILILVRHHKIEHVALSALGQTGADTGPEPAAGLQEKV